MDVASETVRRMKTFTKELEKSMSESASPGMAWVDIAASAYRAYAVSTGGKNFRGDPMPTWDQLPESLRVAWEVAARQAGQCIMDGTPGDESIWKGFKSPKMADDD